MTDNRKSLSRAKSVAFASVDQQDFEATYQRDLINQWLEQVKDASTRYRMEKFNGMNCYFDDNEAKTVGNNAKSFKEQLIETQKHRPIQSGDHFFMRTVDDLAGEKKIPKLVLDHGGTHILDFKDDDGANVCVPFLLDYTRRWNSRLDHFSGVVETEVPLLFTSFNFFCSNTMLIITITLQLYYMIGCAISVIFFGGLTGSIYHTFGVLAGILLVCFFLKI